MEVCAGLVCRWHRAAKYWRGHSGTILSHTTARHDVWLMAQTIEKYSFMLRMQSIDLPNILFGKACRECCKHRPVQEVRPHKYVEQRCSYYSYHDEDVWKHHGGFV